MSRKFLLSAATAALATLIAFSTFASASASASASAAPLSPDVASVIKLCGAGYKLVGPPTPVRANDERRSMVATIYIASNGKKDCAVQRTAGWLAKTPHAMTVYLCADAGNADGCNYTKAPKFISRQGVRTVQLGPIYITDKTHRCVTATGQASADTKIKDATAIGWSAEKCGY